MLPPNRHLCCQQIYGAQNHKGGRWRIHYMFYGMPKGTSWGTATSNRKNQVIVLASIHAWHQSVSQSVSRLVGRLVSRSVSQ